MAVPDAPAIFSPRQEIVVLGWRGRLVALAVGAGCLAVLVLAAWLKPDPSGMSTHLQLGLQPCGFYQAFGIPCPSCGMTTSFAWFARGNIPASLYVQPMGTVLAVLTVLGMWTGLYMAATGTAVHRLLGRVPPRYYVVPLLAAAIIAWAWKIFIHTRGIDGWH